jgi:hypothetical protein
MDEIKHADFELRRVFFSGSEAGDRDKEYQFP